MKVRYFAWIKQTIGAGEEEVSPPDSVRTVGELAGWLSARTPRHAAAFTEARVFGAAIDQKIVPLDTPLGTAREVAFFPPFTGG